jgi:hypothetical protein
MPFDAAQHAGVWDVETMRTEEFMASFKAHPSIAQMGSDQSLIAREIFVLSDSTSVQLRSNNYSQQLEYLKH